MGLKNQIIVIFAIIASLSFISVQSFPSPVEPEGKNSTSGLNNTFSDEDMEPCSAEDLQEDKSMNKTSENMSRQGKQLDIGNDGLANNSTMKAGDSAMKDAGNFSL